MFAISLSKEKKLLGMSYTLLVDSSVFLSFRYSRHKNMQRPVKTQKLLKIVGIGFQELIQHKYICH